MTRYRLLSLASVLLLGALVAIFCSVGQWTAERETPIVIVAGAADRPVADPPPVAIATPAVLDQPSDPVLTWVGGWQGLDGASMQIRPDPAAGAGHYRVTLPIGMAGEMATRPAETAGSALLVHRPYADYVFHRGSGESSADARLARKSDCLTTSLGEAYCR